MRKVDKDGILLIDHCSECPYHQADEYNPYRKWCTHIRPGQAVEISVNLDFPTACPLTEIDE